MEQQEDNWDENTSIEFSAKIPPHFNIKPNNNKRKHTGYSSIPKPSSQEFSTTVTAID